MRQRKEKIQAVMEEAFVVHNIIKYVETALTKTIQKWCYSEKPLRLWVENNWGETVGYCLDIFPTKL